MVNHHYYWHFPGVGPQTNARGHMDTILRNVNEKDKSGKRFVFFPPLDRGIRHHVNGGTRVLIQSLHRRIAPDLL